MRIAAPTLPNADDPATRAVLRDGTVAMLTIADGDHGAPAARVATGGRSVGDRRAGLNPVIALPPGHGCRVVDTRIKVREGR